MRQLGIIVWTAACVGSEPAADVTPPVSAEQVAPWADISQMWACERHASLATGDLDGDGRDDVYMGCGDGAPRLFLHTVAGLVEASERLPLGEDPALRDRQVPAVADFDGDGDLDLLIPAGDGVDGCCGAQQAYENADGEWTDVAEKMELRDTARRGRVALWADMDADGQLELLVASARKSGDAPEQSLLRMWRLTSGRWTDRAESWGLVEAENVGAALAVDLDRDGDAEIVLTSRLALDEGEPEQALKFLVPRVVDRAEVNRIACPDVRDTVTVGAGDLNGDGHADLVFGRLGAPAEVWWNAASGTSPCTWRRTAMGAASVDATGLVVMDVDHDGHLDVVTAGIDGVVLMHQGDGRGDWTVWPLDVPVVGRPILTWLDADGDGVAEIAMATDDEGGRSSFQLLNIPTHDMRGLVLRLRDDSRQNTWGVGARVRFVSDTRSWYRWVKSGGGWRAALPPQVHVGTGSVEWVDVVVEWPDGHATTVLALPTEGCWVIDRPGGVAPCL